MGDEDFVISALRVGKMHMDIGLKPSVCHGHHFDGWSVAITSVSLAFCPMANAYRGGVEPQGLPPKVICRPP
jgi:hypothetical protein